MGVAAVVVASVVLTVLLAPVVQGELVFVVAVAVVVGPGILGVVGTNSHEGAVAAMLSMLPRVPANLDLLDQVFVGRREAAKRPWKPQLLRRIACPAGEEWPLAAHGRNASAPL